MIMVWRERARERAHGTQLRYGCCAVKWVCSLRLVVLFIDAPCRRIWLFFTRTHVHPTPRARLASRPLLTAAPLLRYVGLAVYQYILVAAGVDESHWVDAGMHGLTFASYNLILAGLFT